MARIGELIGPNGEVMHPKTSASVVYLEDGRSVEQVLSDDVDYGNVVFQDNSYKFDSDVEDDFAKTVIIKGQTYQNILPEPSTHVLTNNKEMFKVNEGLDPNVEIVDGVSKSAILKGQTLVNLIDFNEIKRVEGEASYEDGVITYNANSKWTGITFNLPTVKNSTVYTVVIDVLENTLSSNEYQVLWCFYGETNIFNKGFGIHKFTIRSWDDVTPNMSIALKLQNVVASGVFKFKLMIIEGDHTNEDTPYFTGMQSVKLPVLKTTGKNLIDNEVLNYEFDGASSTGYTISVPTAESRIIIIDVKPSTTYTLSWGDLTGYHTGHIRVGEFKEKTIGSVSISQFATNIGNSFKTFTTTSQTNFIAIKVKDGVEILDNEQSLMLVEGSEKTPYEPYKSNILTVNEEVELRGIGDVRDTLNCLTGEVTQRIGEIVLDDTLSYEHAWRGGHDTETDYVIGVKVNNHLWNVHHEERGSLIKCDKLRTRGITSFNGYGYFLFYVSKSVLGEELTNAKIREYILSLNATVQYPLATPVVKTVDLSSSGNWEKVVLDGSEDGWFLTSNASQTTVRFRMNLNPQSYGIETGFCDKFVVAGNTSSSMETESIMLGDTITIRIKKDKAETLNEFKQWLSQNPVTVWYQTTTHQDSTQVKQPIFFKDGHIIQSSGADSSLIPTLDYQAKTSNSYVMDLMKANTIYTMKNDSANGKFTIDGTQYNLVTNGKLKTPTTLTDKLLVINGSASNTMILEGDLTSKTIPYFKGIKSAFEDESKIEVLSTGKNLTHHILGGNPESKEYNFMNIIETHKNTSGALNRAKVIKWVEKDKFFIKGYGIDQYDNQYNIDLTPTVLKPNTTYFISFESIEGSHEQQEDMKLTLGAFNVWLNNTRVIRAYEGGTYTFTTPSQVDSFNLNLWLDGTKNKNATIYAIFNKFMITEGKSIDEGYEPHKSNNTKIPLLSPLRSLPNGVCDELIVDRMKKKATLIQRVGVGVLDGTQNINMVDSSVDTSLYQPFFCGDVFGNMAIVSRNVVVVRCNKLLANSEPPPYRELTFNAIFQYPDSSARLAGQITKKDLGVKSVKDWFRANPTTIYYQLATPVVTEIDLEGFPYIYKDGHIFLNSEIAPTVGIEYSINQGHRISSQVVTLQRHEKQFSKLEQYFADLVYSDYNFALLRFSEKLRQQEGDV